MDENRVIAAGIAAAIVLSGIVMAVVRGPSLSGLTPVETAIFAIIGVAIPQSILARENQSRPRWAVAGLAFCGGVGALGYGFVRDSLLTPRLNVFMGLLLVGVVAAWLVGVGRAFFFGYRAAAE